MATTMTNRTNPVRRKRRADAAAREAWEQASMELGIDLTWTDLPLARGQVNQHDVMATLGVDAHRKGGVRTTYRVRFAAPSAPNFKLTKRFSRTDALVDTGDSDFDSSVTVVTDDPAAFTRFMTPARRHGVVRLLTLWPLAEIRSNEAVLSTDGIESDPEQIVDSICHLVATAETFDRPTTSERSAVGSPSSNDAIEVIQLDEASVLQDLFGSGRSAELAGARFEQCYRGRDVNWTGEVLNLGSRDQGGRRIAVLVGSADGRDADSGRVVALTTIPNRSKVEKGHVISFSGSLLHLDARRRLFSVD